MKLVPRGSVRLVTLAASTAALLLATSTALGGSIAEPVVEGGAYFDYVAPDAGTSTDGAIRFGFSGSVEVIAATAELVPPADTNLEFLGGGTPTCLRSRVRVARSRGWRSWPSAP